VVPASRADEARKHIETCSLPVVVKADGLAAGKGVTVCTTRDEARESLAAIIEQRVFGAAGDVLVIEEHLAGTEASLFVVTDGSRYVTLTTAQDYKRALDGDHGKNTGGMGAYAPARTMTPEILREVEESIVAPTLLGMAEEGRPYRGCLYIGLMLTGKGPQVVEFNCRFGDPETQVVLPVYQGDLAALLLGAAKGDLRPALATPARIEGFAVCVVLTAAGYPDSYPKGMPIKGLDEAAALPGVVVFHAGTRREGAEFQTAGGRVLGVTAHTREGTLEEAMRTAYKAASLITFENMHFRKDIGKPGSGPAGKSLP
jgi:phosphoribosylamine--glycine ligase